MAKRRGKKYCIAYGCLNNNSNDELSFFNLPQDAERCQEWLSLLNREDLLATPNFKYVCSVHFKDTCFKISGLKKGSLPIKITLDQPQGSSSSGLRKEVQVLSNIQGTKPTTANQMSQTEPLEKLEKKTQTLKSLTAQTPRKRKQSEELRNSQHKCRRLDMDILKIQKELQAKNTPITSDPADEVAKRFHKLIDWQNKLKNNFKGNRYDREYIFFALNLYYASPHTYRFLQTILKLPNKRTIIRFKMNIPPKLDDRVMKSLEFKIKSLPDAAKYCSICVDEMTLKRNLYYNIKTDELIGFHNINENISPEIARNAYTIMLQGIQIKWKQPLAYSLLASAKHYEELDLWLEEIVSRLFAIGIKVKAITSDQGSNFDKFAKDIKHVTVDKPYFMYDEKKIFYIFDVPHLIKCIRNNLITSDFHYGDKKISWDYIKQLYDYDSQKDKKISLIPKLTESHIDPNNFKKMRVKYAVQVFSRTVSAALHTYIDLGVISEEARPTADFVETMNNLFDILNSSKIKCNNKYQTALRRCDFQEKALDDALEMFSKIKAINKKSKKLNTAHMKSFVNAQISIQSIKNLYEDLKKEGIKYLLTRRLNQDCLNIFFGSIRQRSGSGTEPTPIQFQRAFSKLFVTNMLSHSPNANCEADLYNILLQSEDVMKSFKLSISESAAITSVVCLDDEADYRFDLPEENALTYVSGYLLFKCLSKHRCENIDEALKSVPDLRETNLFTKYKAHNKQSGFYGALKMPPSEFIHYIQNLEEVFTQNFEKTLLGNPGAKLYELMQAVSPQMLCSCFPLNYLLKLFIRLRIYATVRFNNRKFKDEKKEFKKYVKIKQLSL